MEPRANFYVSDTWTSQTVVSVYALQSQKPAIPGTQVSKSAAPATLGGDSDPCANLATELDFAERQSIAIQEFRHLVGGSQGFLLGASQSRQRLRQFRFVYTRIVACPGCLSK
jgi:hypothetical protein